MTESAVTVVKKERVAVYNIDFDLNLESDYFKDGYSIEITGNKTEYNKDDEVEFTVSLNDSYNKNINVDSQLSTCGSCSVRLTHRQGRAPLFPASLTIL